MLVLVFLYLCFYRVTWPSTVLEVIMLVNKMTSSSKIHMKCLYFITISCIVYNFLWVFWILLNISLSFNSNKRAWVNWMVIKLAANAPLKHEQWMDPIFQNSFFSFFVLLFVFECFCIPMYNNPLVKFNHTRCAWLKMTCIQMLTMVKNVKHYLSVHIIEHYLSMK